MIESIFISDIENYGNTPEVLSGLGSGKTTISRLIADETKFPNCTITWEKGTD